MSDFNEIILPVILIFFFLVQCAFVGFAFNSQLNLWSNQQQSNDDFCYLKWFFALSTGLTINILLLFILGITGFLSSNAVKMVGTALVTTSFWQLSKSFLWLDYIKEKRLSRTEALELLCILLLFLFFMLQSIKVPGHWDDTMYHLPLARFYLENHKILMNEYLRFPLFPQNMELLFALGLMIGGDTVAQCMAINGEIVY